VRLVLLENEVETFAIEPPSIEKDPKQYHKLMESEALKRSSILSITVPNDKGEIATIAAVLDESTTPEEWDERTIDSLLTIFRFLNPYLVHQNDPGGDSLTAYMNPDEELHLDDRDCSVLHRCIHAFAAQEFIYKEPSMSTKWRSRRAASFAATDIIRNLKFGSQGRLRRFISRQMISNDASQGLWKILSKFCLVTDMKKERRNAIDTVHTELMQGLPNLDPHDLWLLLYDNIGFKVKKGYEQFTAMQWVRISKEKLTDWGLYPKEGDTLQSCPFQDDHEYAGLTHEDLWKRINWEEARKDTPFEDVLGIDDDDIERLADSTYNLIDQILQVFDDFPSFDEAIELLKRVDKRVFSQNFQAQGNRERVSNDGTDTSDVAVRGTEVRESEIQEKEIFESNYKANNAYLDRPTKRDLNAKSTCRSMMDYAIEMKNRVVGLEGEGRWANIPKILDKMPIPLCGDGNPTFLMGTILQEEHEKYKGKVSAFTGGFHMMLEAHRKRGDAFGKSHMEDIFSCWRPTEGQLRWVMNPGDPNQISAELSMYVLAMYSAAIQSCLKTKASSASSDQITICAKDVVTLMIERAKSYPIVMMILIELRFAQLAFMLHESERKGGNVNLYLTATKFLGRLYASTHCTKYTSMLVDFFVEWYSCSPAKKIVYAKGIFTRKTKYGETIFTVCWLL